MQTFPNATDHSADLCSPLLMGRRFTLLLDFDRFGAMFACTLAISLSFGCGTFVRSTYVNDPPRPLTPVDAQQVEVFVSAPPQRDYVDVALLEVEQTQSVNRTGTDYMIEELRAAAGAMGCDAVVLTGATEHSANDDRLFDQDSKTLLASCIVYKTPERDAVSTPGAVRASTDGPQPPPPSPATKP